MLPHKRLSEVYDRAMIAGLESLSVEERELYLVQDFIVELEVGGLSGYFYNRLPLRNHIHAAISAMRTFGIDELGELLNEAYQLFEAYSEADAASTWAEVLRRIDPGNRLAVIEKRIEAIDDYGIEGSRIK
jgi:hypothetical protein